MFKLKSPGFLIKKSTFSRFSKIQVDKPDCYSGQYIRLYPTSFPRDVLYLYDFDLYITQTTQKTLGKTVYKILVWSLSTVWYAKTKLSRANFWEVVLKLLQISREKLLGIHLRSTDSVKNFPWMFPKVLTFPKYLQLISSYTW